MECRKLLVPGAVAAGILALTTAALTSQDRRPNVDWRYFGGDRAFTRYSPLDQINAGNVANWRIAWRHPASNDVLTKMFPALRTSPYLKATPIAVDGVLYTQDAYGLVRAINGGTGQTIWQQELAALTRDEANGSSTRGLDYWQAGNPSAEKRIFAIRGEYLYALDAATGKAAFGFGEHGRVSLHFSDQPLAGRFSDSTGPLVLGTTVVVTGNTAGAGDHGNKKAAAPEDVRAYDARTGKHLWTFHVVPPEGQLRTDTWGNESWRVAGDMGAWNQMTGDEELGLVYVPLTAPTSAWYGGWRPGDNLFSNCLVALDIKTGNRVWYFQTVHHDLWDYDNVGPAILGDITVDGRRIKAVMQANKNAFLFVLDRTNGKPVWPIEERPVPQSTVPGEHSSRTQPFPTKPPALDQQGIADADLIDYTPELKARARALVKDYVMGPMFTPPSVVPGPTKGTLVMPGALGAANWNTGAFDPETGMYYGVTRTQGPAVRSVTKQTGAEGIMDYSDVPNPDLMIDGLPIIKGPYGRITALNLNTGTLSWTVANGEGPRNHPLLKNLPLPPLGVTNRPAPLVTKTLLFLGEGSNSISGTLDTDWGWGKTFRAYDKTSGKVMAEIKLPSGTTAGPMTYMLKGKQYIVVAVGAKDHAPEYVALSLP